MYHRGLVATLIKTSWRCIMNSRNQCIHLLRTVIPKYRVAFHAWSLSMINVSNMKCLSRTKLNAKFINHIHDARAPEVNCNICTVYPKKYAHGFCFAVLCCGYTLTDFPISIRLTSLALWQSNDCPSASKATLMDMDKYLMWIHYERLHNHNKAKHIKTVCIFLGIYCTYRKMNCCYSRYAHIEHEIAFWKALLKTIYIFLDVASYMVAYF